MLTPAGDGMTSRPLSILLPVDGSENSNRAVELLSRLYEKLAPMDVRVLHVLIPPVVPDDELFRREAVEWNSPDGGKNTLRSAEALLAGAGIPYTSEIRRGYIPQEIANYAKELNCSAIIMGTRGMGSTEQMFGSIVRQLVALTVLPVTLVK